MQIHDKRTKPLPHVLFSLPQRDLSLALGLLLAVASTAGGQIVINSQPQDQTNLVGSTTIFAVVAGSTDPLSYQWTFGSPPIGLVGATNATLVITNVQVAHQGPYQVIISDGGPAVTSAVANLYVVPPAVLQFSATAYSVAESAGTVALNVQRSGNINLAISVNYFTSDSSAKNGDKYTAVSGTLTFALGQISQVVTVPILNNGLAEGTKVFHVTLSNPSIGARFGPPSTTSVSILDNDVGVQFQFPSNGPYPVSVAEDDGVVLIRVVRGDDGSLPVSVDCFNTDLTATNGLDYTGLSTNLIFGVQERIKSLSIPILNNSIRQPNRTFRLTLANPVGITLGGQRTATVTIIDNDQGFEFDAASYMVLEGAGEARINVHRGTDDNASTSTVTFATADGSATSGVHYLGTNGTLSFGPGERVKVVRVPILNNGVKQATRNFRVLLGSPSPGAFLGSSTNVTVSILDNDPGLGFERTAYTNSWGPGEKFDVTVVRGKDPDQGLVTVDYTTGDLTAVAGQDYQPVSGTLEFRPGETVKTIGIPILRNRAAPGAKRFRVLLSSPTGGATLGNSSATVTIVGAYVIVAPPFDTALDIASDGGVEVLSWNGGGPLQRADYPDGPWQTLNNAASPYTTQATTPATFYRAARPRPVNVYVPSSYDDKTQVPLIILLHSYSQTGASEESYTRFEPLAEARGFLYCYPDSSVDIWGQPFWNATDTCCDFANTGVDDAGYLRRLIEEILRRFAVDRKRVFLIGHSNGGFMVNRMACESADLIAGIASLAGMTFLDPGRCTPSEVVNVLHIHGTADEFIGYWGGALVGFPANMAPFPGALKQVQLWAAHNGAKDPVTDATASLDLTTDVAGLDTVVTRYTNAPPGGAVELWTINNGVHDPNLSPQFAPKVIDWLLAHPKP